MMKVYTLKTCDTCKKALKWLDEKNVSYQNQDIRADGLDPTTIEKIVTHLGWETALNRRSTTWRGLSEEDKTDIDNNKAAKLIAANPTLMKRPVFVVGENFVAGFDAKAQTALQTQI